MVRSQREHSDRRGKLARVGVHCRFEGGATKVVRAFAGTDLTAAARHGSPSSSSVDSLLRVSGGRLEAAARNLVSCAAISFEALPASSRCSVKAAMRGGRPLPRSAPQAAETSTCMLFSRAHHTSTMHKQLREKINSASSQSVCQSGSSPALTTPSQGTAPLPSVSIQILSTCSLGLLKISSSQWPRPRPLAATAARLRAFDGGTGTPYWNGDW